MQRADRRDGRDQAEGELRGGLSDGRRACRALPAVKAYALKRLANRTHRKILVADGRVGLTGGVGIAEEWTVTARTPTTGATRTCASRGPSCGAVRRVRGELARGDRRGARRRGLPARDRAGRATAARYGRALQRGRRGLQHRGALLPRDRGGARDARPHRGVLRAAARVRRGARRTAPSAACARACSCRAQHRQAAVWIAGRASYDDLVAAGVEVYEYRPTMLHAKTMCVDGCWSAVGSANFDNRSFQLNDEATLCVASRGVRGAADRAVRARPRGLGADRRRSAGSRARPLSARRRRAESRPPRAVAPPSGGATGARSRWARRSTLRIPSRGEKLGLARPAAAANVRGAAGQAAERRARARARARAAPRRSGRRWSRRP